MNIRLLSILFYFTLFPHLILSETTNEIPPSYHWFDEFTDLEKWEPLTFPDIDNHTLYEIRSSESGNTFLTTKSMNGASGLISKDYIDISESHFISWRWKVSNILEKGDANKKSGDDYPLRIYIMYEFDPDHAGFWELLKFKAIKLIYGKYPPKYALNYIWANRFHKEQFIENAYTSRAMMIAKQYGGQNIGKWQKESANLLEDYRNAFGEDPKGRGKIAIMSDTDNTGESAEAFLDYIRIANTPIY